MSCFFVNGSFVVAFLGGVTGTVFSLVAQRNRAPDAPPGSYWRSGWDLFRPRVFTARGNDFRRRALVFNGLAAALLLICVTIIFTQRGDQLGLCWLQILGRPQPN